MRALVLAMALAACSSSASPGKTGGGGPGDVERGRAIYTTTCIACHNIDPAQPGPIGPEVKGASRELIEARVVKGTYPPGYKPKRDTQLMTPMPQVADSVDDLAAFLK